MLESRTLGGAPDAVRRRLPLKLRLMSRQHRPVPARRGLVVSRMRSGKAYRLNRFAIGRGGGLVGLTDGGGLEHTRPG